MTFRLINPNISNDMFTSNDGNLDIASAEIWDKVSSHIKGYVPKFYYSIQNTNDGSIHHYKVEEKDKNNNVSYNIQQLNDEKIKRHDKILVQQGGYSHHHSKHNKKIKMSSSSSSSSSSKISLSSSSDDVIFNYNPRYNPLTFTYYPAVYGVEDIIIPTFLRTLYGRANPTLKIVLPTEYVFNVDLQP